MSTLLYIKASPRGDRSHSLAVADAFAESYRDTHPDATVDVLELFRADLPAFDGAALQAKYRLLHGEDVAEEERTAWAAVEAQIDRFKAADRYLLAVPMWNFGIPYRLKHYFDVIVQPGYTFSYSTEAGYGGLVSGSRAAVVYARGGAYAPGSPTEPYDKQKPYVEAILGFMGIVDQVPIVVEPTLAEGPDAAAAQRDAAIAEAREIAAGF